MADLRYGRLFTEKDVRLLMRYAYAKGQEGEIVDEDEEGRLVDAGVVLLMYAEQDLQAPSPFTGLTLTFPPDEPLFLLRGQDKAAPDAIEEYGQRALDAGHADGDDKRERLIPLLEAIHRAEGEMRLWQRDHPERVKRPGSDGGAGIPNA